MTENQVTWVEASASVGVSAHGSYGLERAMRDSGYVKFEYDLEYLDAGGYRILDKRVKKSKGPWFVDGLMSAEDWQVLQPIALQAVADMREAKALLDARVKKLRATYGYRLAYANNHGKKLPAPSTPEEEKLYAELRPNSDVGRKVAERQELTLEREERAKALRQARHDLQFREDEIKRAAVGLKMYVKAGGGFTQADADEIMERYEDDAEAARKHLDQLEEEAATRLQGETPPVDVAEKLIVAKGPTSTTKPTKSKDHDDRILAALRSYDGRLTKRKGWPFYRSLRTHAGFHITKAERKRLWPVILKERE